jgi:hypothetical protein
MKMMSVICLHKDMGIRGIIAPYILYLGITWVSFLTLRPLRFNPGKGISLSIEHTRKAGYFQVLSGRFEDISLFSWARIELWVPARRSRSLITNILYATSSTYLPILMRFRNMSHCPQSMCNKLHKTWFRNLKLCFYLFVLFLPCTSEYLQHKDYQLMDKTECYTFIWGIILSNAWRK